MGCFLFQLTDDNIAYNHANKELLQKITLNENGITSNAISDRHIQEQNHAELLKLNSSLNAALSKLDRRVLLVIRRKMLQLNNFLFLYYLGERMQGDGIEIAKYVP